MLLVIHPSRPTTNSGPSMLLVAAVLSEGFIALLSHFRRKDCFQPHIMAGCALIATFAAAIQDIGIVGFLFGYLFWGCLVGVLVTWFAHRTSDLREVKVDLKLYRFRKSAENTCESCRESMLDMF